MSWKHRTNVREPNEASPSKRWSTVARSSMEEIASHLKINPPNVGQMQRVKTYPYGILIIKSSSNSLSFYDSLFVTGFNREKTSEHKNID